MLEDKTLAALLMDRSEPLGNSEDKFTRRSLHVKVGNKSTEPIPVIFNPAATPIITNVTAPVAGTEYSHTLNPTVAKFLIRTRKYSQVQFCFTSGQSGTNYLTVPSGCEFSEDQILFTNGTIYFQCNKADEILEVLEWF